MSIAGIIYARFDPQAVSHPVCIESQTYARNQFIFNFAFVLSQPDVIDVPSYRSVIVKLAHLMRSLEEQTRFLSDDPSEPGTGKVYSLCETLMEDLNNYAECMIPIDDVNTLNVKLFPTLPNPAPVKAWHVPLFAVRIESLMDHNWDLTMQRIIPFINGVNSVKKIAILADADLGLTRKCVRHLLYYGCVLLLDIFSFNAIYAPTAEFTGMIATDLEMQAECARYVNTAFEPARLENLTTGTDVAGSFKASSIAATNTAITDNDFWPLTARGDVADGVSIVQLYACLRQGLTVREWFLQNSNMLANIDIRRFVTFGIIKGFLYRVHRYAVQTNFSEAGNKSHQTHTASEMHNFSSATSTSTSKSTKRRTRLPLVSFLDGTHSFDEMCTYFEISENELLERLDDRRLGEVVVLCR
ncbi:Nitrogen permease regulator 2 [Lithohypha guttulata]|nr:Nitrogen permease regulator 2 [Lithohypha guttulata]